MTNKERREIIERAKASGYAGDYVELFRTGAAKLAITEEERQKGLRPYHEAGDTGQTMAFPNTPPNTPFNTIGMKKPVRVTKVVGDKIVKDQVVPPGVSSFNTGSGYGTVIEAPELRARAQEGGRVKEAIRIIKEHNLNKKDSSFENFVEAVDPTGISSWDDAARAVTEIKGDGQLNFDRALDIFGAVPIAGKAKPILNFAKAAIRPGKYYATKGYNYLRKNYGDLVNRADALEDETGFLDKFQEGGRPNFDESGLPIAYASAVDLEDYMSKTRGNTREFWKATADTIAYHENAIPMTGRMSLSRPQIGGGPGKGLFQFETKDNPDKDAFETAKQRYINTVKVMPGFKPDPDIVKAKDAADLDKEQQYAVFHANLIEGPAKLADYASGKMSIEDLWLKGHKRVEKSGDRESFRESQQAARKDDLKKYGLRYGGVRYNKRDYKR